MRWKALITLHRVEEIYEGKSRDKFCIQLEITLEYFASQISRWKVEFFKPQNSPLFFSKTSKNMWSFSLVYSS